MTPIPTTILSKDVFIPVNVHQKNFAVLLQHVFEGVVALIY
jgi:hypothetical protein